MSYARPVAALVAGLVVLSILSAGALGQGKSGEVHGSARVKNETPMNLRIDVGNDADPDAPGTQVSPDADGETQVSFTGRAEDGNGWQDLRRAEFTVYRADGTVLAGPVAGDPANHGAGRLREFTASFAMSSQEPAGTYTVHMTAWDRHDASAVANATFDYQEILALAVDSGSISFGDGAVGPGASTHDAPSAVVVRNTGNVRLDLHVSSNGLSTPSGDATIGPEYLKYDTNRTMASERALSADGITDTAFDLDPGQSRTAYLDLHMPTGDQQYVPADTYSGTISLGGVSG